MKFDSMQEAAQEAERLIEENLVIEHQYILSSNSEDKESYFIFNESEVDAQLEAGFKIYMLITASPMKVSMHPQ